ncbi:hypothetical protein MPSI1_003587 [Malassezia psittaci]|uniref:CAP-Gly domain-containing protein n=1 Tax=Malassezia psittaci TaxID=1821823 RepID=A0AAF0F934_9BASI|nr:hypothetical protein MPSI1_003587 [Malassezia psittaci]
MSYATPNRRGGRASMAKAHHTPQPVHSFEIGDEVRFEGSELVGNLRYLGPVQGKDGYFAGLELIGSSVGHGKNDGTIAGVQYFATSTNNGVFGPASKLVRNTDPNRSVSASGLRPVSSRSSSRTDDRPSSRLRQPHAHAPLPNGTPQRTPSSRPKAYTAGGPRRAPNEPTSSPYGMRTASMPRAIRRPTSAISNHPRPGSVLRSPQRGAMNFAFEDTSSNAKDDVDRRRNLWEQMHLQQQQQQQQQNSLSSQSSPFQDMGPPSGGSATTDAGSGASDAIAIGCTSRSGTPSSKPSPNTKTSATRGSSRHTADPMPNLEDLHKELQSWKAAAASKDTKLTQLQTQLELAQKNKQINDQPTESAPSSSPNANLDQDPLSPRIQSMVLAWERERVELTSRIEELQGAGREAIGVLEHQLDLAAREQQALRAQVQHLETQWTIKEQAQASDQSASATEIEMSTLREQLAHLTLKHDSLKQQLSETQESLRSAQTDADRSSSTHQRTLQNLEQELRTAREEAKQHHDAMLQAQDEVQQLKDTLHAEQLAWEQERQAREEAQTSSPKESSMLLQKKYEALEKLHKEQADAHAKEIAELEALVESRIFREDELETELEQLRRERDEALAASKPNP